MEAAFGWSDEYLLGDELLDGQHRKMFQLFEASLEMESPGEIRAVLMKLYILIREHFFDEEALMELKGYPEREAHAREHARVLERMDGFSATLFDAEVSLGELRETIRQSVVQHLLEQDMGLITFLRCGGAT